MEEKFDIAVIGPETTKKRVRSVTQDNVNKTIAKRESIVREFGIENPRWTLEYAVDQACRYLLKIHHKAGINLKKKDIPDVIFVDEKRKKELEKAIQPYGGANFADKEAGSSSVWNGVVIIFVKEDITDLDQASIIFHEMFHFLGEQIIAANEKSAAYGRQGYEIFGVNSPYKSWLLEGGLVTFESARFGEELATDTFYKKDSEIRTQMIEHAMQSGDIVEGRLKFDSGMEVEPRYLWIMPEYQGIKDRKAFGLPENSGLAGSFFELISSRFQGEEKDNFLNIVYAARRDLKLIPKLAGLIDDKFSRGTYARMLKCERTEEAVWNFIQDLRGRTNSNSYRVT